MQLLRLALQTIPPIHKEGHPFVFMAAALTFLLGIVWIEIGWVGTVITLWVAYFFRNPPRFTPKGDEFIVSPADGKVSKIEKADPPPELGLDSKKRTRISIFLNVFDVHMNRIPASGEIVDLHYHPGKFLSANLDKASTDNERQTVLMKNNAGQEIIFVQIAGLVARRIVCDLEEKQIVESGDHYGLIRFGSRVDVYLPDGVNPQVVEGQYMIGGETVLADTKSKSAARKGELKI